MLDYVTAKLIDSCLEEGMSDASDILMVCNSNFLESGGNKSLILTMDEIVDYLNKKADAETVFPGFLNFK